MRRLLRRLLTWLVRLALVASIVYNVTRAAEAGERLYWEWRWRQWLRGFEQRKQRKQRKPRTHGPSCICARCMQRDEELYTVWHETGASS